MRPLVVFDGSEAVGVLRPAGVFQLSAEHRSAAPDQLAPRFKRVNQADQAASLKVVPRELAEKPNSQKMLCSNDGGITIRSRCAWAAPNWPASFLTRSICVR